MKHKVGDKKRFTPTACAAGDNGSEASRLRNERSKVDGVATMVNHEHRWYRVTYKPLYGREQHECFKF